MRTQTSEVEEAKTIIMMAATVDTAIFDKRFNKNAVSAAYFLHNFLPIARHPSPKPTIEPADTNSLLFVASCVKKGNSR
jgi:hypothetical protein